MPILPLVLVNGAEGIGTGWSTSIPNFSPRDIVANLQRLLAGQETVAMAPWYRGFRGAITEVPTRTSGKSYNCSGIIAQVRCRGNGGGQVIFFPVVLRCERQVVLRLRLKCSR